jgi:phage terminase large subunit-like protein
VSRATARHRDDTTTFVREAIMRNQWAKLGGVLGVVYCIAGFVLIFFGWNGTASNDRVEAQLPYVVSGGIAGLALVVLGAALIVAHSLRTDRVELRASIDELRRSVVATAPAPGATAATADRAAGGEVVAGASSYHVPSCALVVGQAGATRMAVADAVAAGLEPCRICHPDRLVA